MAPAVAESDTIEITDLEELFGEVIPCEACENPATWRVGDDCCWIFTCTPHKEMTVEVIRGSMRRKTTLYCMIHQRSYRATMLNVTEL